MTDRWPQRSFSRDAITAFLLAQSQPYPDMVELVWPLWARYGLKAPVVTNNGREFLSYLLKSCVSYAREEDRKRLHS